MYVYRNPVTAPIARDGGQYPVRASTCQWEMLEGDAPSITGLTLTQFPTMGQVRSWYRDADYQPFVEIRRAGASAI